MTLVPAIFLDRDGVIIHNRKDYVRSLEQVKIYPQALKALARLKDSPYKIVLVTNQAGIGKGLIPREVVEEIHTYIITQVEQAGGRIDAVFVCPHTPADGCDCRKPLPGLLLAAAQSLCLDLSRSIMIGDALSDIEAGQRAGVKQTVLVLTGRGKQQQFEPQRARLQPFDTQPSLLHVVKDNISTFGQGKKEKKVLTRLENPAKLSKCY
jgi:D-glycero-D-manno-heptose 1,7-bisphosphate phosphatase